MQLTGRHANGHHASREETAEISLSKATGKDGSCVHPLCRFTQIVDGRGETYLGTAVPLPEVSCDTPGYG